MHSSQISTPSSTARELDSLSEMPGNQGLSHVDAEGSVQMVDVGGKPHERRRAVAEGRVVMGPDTAAALRSLPKGDALATAQVAGIMAAKRTADLIPLCHPLPLTSIDVEVGIGEHGVEIVATVPTSEILRYAIDLRSMTGGRGRFTARHSHYDPVPAHLADKISAGAH